jgi:hypothetical protein
VCPQEASSSFKMAAIESSKRANIRGMTMIRYEATKMELPMFEATRRVTSPAQGKGSSP